MSNRWGFGVLTEPGSLDRTAVARTFAALARRSFRDLVAEFGFVAGSDDAGGALTFADLDAAADYLAARDGLVVLWSSELRDHDVRVSFHHADPAARAASPDGRRCALCRFDEISFSVLPSDLTTGPCRDVFFGTLRELFEEVAVAEEAPYGYLLDEYAAEDLLPAPSGAGLVPCAGLPLVLGWLTWFGPRDAPAVDAALVEAVGASAKHAGGGSSWTSAARGT